MSKQSMYKHLSDIDFRTREVRQENAIEDFKNWYNHLASLPYNETTHAQLTMLSSVLWYLLPKNEYKKLITDKTL